MTDSNGGVRNGDASVDCEGAWQCWLSQGPP